MPIMSLVNKRIAFSAMLITAYPVATAEVPAPKQVDLTGERRLQQNDKQLLEIDTVKGKVSSIRLPKSLDRAFRRSSSIVFPVDHSQLIEEKEYVLVVVNQPSSPNPTGYCGAGEEGTLYVLELQGSNALPRFSSLVQSCLKNYILASEYGQKSGYLAITWKNAPIGIHIQWDIHGDINGSSRFYRYENGQFKDAKD